MTAARCDGCGYDLRGLSPDGQCPECGLAIRPASARTMIAWPAELRYALAAAVGGLLLTIVGRLVYGASIFLESATGATAGASLCAVGGAAGLVGLGAAAAQARYSPLAARAGVRWPLFLSSAAELAWSLGLLACVWYDRGSVGPTTALLLLTVAAAGSAAGLAWGGLLARLAAADVRYDLADNALMIQRLRGGGELTLLLGGVVMTVAIPAEAVVIVAAVGCCGLCSAVLYVVLLLGNLTAAARICRSLLRPTYGRQ